MTYFIDFEAAQFSERIISIGCVAGNGNTFSTLVRLIKKKDKIGSFVTKLTGITEEMLADAPTPDEAFNDFFSFVIANADDAFPEYFCYGNTDKTFIYRTLSQMKDVRAITFAQALATMIQDYSVFVKKYFGMSDNIGLKKVYNLVQSEDIVQHHDALEDAQMLFTIASNMTINCKPEDRTKLMPKQEKHKCVLVGNLAKAPRQFVDWPSCLWDADTEADETNWILKCETENRIKYFASRDTAILWIMRYLVKGVSVKKAEDREKISERLDTGIKIGTRYWGVRWTQNIPEERIEE